MSAAAATFAKKRPGGIQEWTPVSGHNSKKAKTPVAMREEPKSPTKPLSAPGSQTERVLFSGDTIEDSEGSEPESDFETKPPSLKWETEDILDYENTAKRQRKRPSLAAGRKPSLI